MMPEMDGVETVKKLRELDKKIPPIVALTANAVSGMIDFFLSNGFDDFLSKPIDTNKLGAILDKYVPEDMRQELSLDNQAKDKNNESENITEFESLFRIGVDVQKGFKLTGGSAERYKMVLSKFEKDAQLPDYSDLTSYRIVVHGLKSISATIGADNVSAKAARLERAAIDGDKDYIMKNHFDFAENLQELLRAIKGVFPKDEESNNNENAKIIDAELLSSLKVALDEYDAEKINDLLNKLNGTKLYEEINDYITMGDYDNALEIANKY